MLQLLPAEGKGVRHDYSTSSWTHCRRVVDVRHLRVRSRNRTRAGCVPAAGKRLDGDGDRLFRVHRWPALRARESDDEPRDERAGGDMRGHWTDDQAG